MPVDSDHKSFSRYFPASVRDRKWGWHVTTAGEMRLLPGQPYPPSGHPKGYNFDWTKGRVLDAHALLYISRGRGSFESRQSARQPIEAGQVIFLFPGVWVKNKFFSPRTPVFKPGQEEKWLTLFTELIAVIKLNRPALQQVMAGFTAQMLGLLYSGQQAGLAGDDQALLIVQRAIAKMQTELESGLNAQALARDLNVSYSSFRYTSSSTPAPVHISICWSCAWCVPAIC